MTWDRYGRGEAEERGGPATEPYRDRIFLAEKTGKRTKDKAAAELRESLVRMRTDRLDLYQFHGVTTLEEVETIVGPGGALEAFVEAREQGLVRYLGFSAHSEEAALALMDHYDFDSVLFPVNYVAWYQRKFGPAVVKKAQEKGVGILALKVIAKKPWPDEKKEKWAKAWYSPVDSYEEARIAMGLDALAPRHRLCKSQSRRAIVVDDRRRKGDRRDNGGGRKGHRSLHRRHRTDFFAPLSRGAQPPSGGSWGWSPACAGTTGAAQIHRATRSL